MPVPKEATVALIPGVDQRPEISKVEIPMLEPRAMLAEIQAATLCGTDIHLWHSAAKSMPYIPGHESCGIIVAKSGDHSDVTGEPVEIGDRVIWAYPFCGECFYCSVANQPTMCPNALRFGREPVAVYPHLLGGCATHQYVPPRSSVIKVPDQVSSELAASAACALRTIMHGFERLGRVPAHETAVVQGTGPVGLYALAVAKSRGFKRVLSIGAPETRVAVAREWGADATLNIDDVPDQKERIKWVMEQTGGIGADVVIQCAGNVAVPEGLEMVRAGGRYLSIGEGGGTHDIGVSPRAVSVKMLNIIGVRSGAGRHFYEALQFLKQGKFPFRELITGTYALENVADAFNGMKAMTEVKAAIFPNS
jgi:threonine dehydrogenase-like Zn-dependent dehydrogenase